MKDLTSSWGPVVTTPTRRSMIEVDVAVIRQQATVVETNDVV